MRFTKEYSSDNDDNTEIFHNNDRFINITTSKQNYKRKIFNAKSKITIQIVVCIFIGVLIGFTFATWLRKNILNCSFGGLSCCLNNLYEADFESLAGAKPLEVDESKNAFYKNIEPKKSLVFVGVMTAQKYLDTRARASFETWGQSIPGKMSFFSRAGSTSNFPIPLVSLAGVDDSYPPQKKSFMMLKYMYDHYIDKFEWFMRVDDDVYIKPDKLEVFLRSLNSSKPQFIGQAGLGNKDEFGLLSLDYDENFCMGGPGITMSRETLKRVVPHISSCLKNLYSTHEDVEIGRCIKRFANTSCTWSYEMQHIFHHNGSGDEAYTKDLLSRDVLRAISLHPVKLPQYQYRLHNFFNVRKIIDLRQKNLQLQRDIRAIEKNLLKLNLDRKSRNINKNLIQYDTETDNLPKDRFILTPSFKVVKPPKNRQHRYDFTFFTRSIFSSSYVSPKRGVEGYWKSSINDGMRQVMEDINKNSIQKGRIIDFKDILYGYVRHHPLIGIDYIIDALLVYKKYEGRKMTVPVRRHAYVRQTYTGMFFREDMNFSSIYHHRDDLPQEYLNQQNNDYLNTNKSFFSNNIIIQNLINFILPSQNPNDEILYKRKKNFLTNLFMHGNNEYTPDSNSSKLNYIVESQIKDKIIHFVVPLAGRLLIFKRFMENFENICLKTKENVKLAIVLFQESHSSDDDITVEVNKIVNGLRYKYLNEHLRVISIKANFSRSVACEIGATLYPSKSLVFFVDVDMLFSRDFLLRVRLNTIENKQVYFPIVFSEYDPDPGLSAKRDIKSLEDHFFLNSETGYWRQFGFGIAAAYNSDLRRVGGFDTSIVGWGKEDVDLYEKFVRSNLTVFRTVDPGLVHVFHKIKCDPGLATEQMTMCVGSKSTSIASQRVLANIIYNRKLFLIDPTEPPNATLTAKLEKKNIQNVKN